MGQPPAAIGIAHDPAEPVIGAQGVTTGGHKREHPLPCGGVEPGIRLRRAHLGKQIRFIERPCTGTGHHMLGQHVEPAGAEFIAIALPRQHGIARRQGFEEFEPVAGHQHRAARAVEPVVGASDPLQQA